MAHKRKRMKIITQAASCKHGIYWTLLSEPVWLYSTRTVAYCEICLMPIARSEQLVVWAEESTLTLHLLYTVYTVDCRLLVCNDPPRVYRIFILSL